MNKWMIKRLGASWKTTLSGYILAVMLAVQPLFTDATVFQTKHERIMYLFRIMIAALIAVFGKMSADSSQVKHVDNKLEELKNE